MSAPSDTPTLHLLDEVSLRGAKSAVYRLQVCTGLCLVNADEWNRLLEPDDAPLLSWAYLEGLELSGCVGGETSWQPAHLLIRKVSRSAETPPDLTETNSTGELVAAAPAYVKQDSDGEWVYDFDWAAFAETQGRSYYPKLVLAVPFNPVSGGRLLCRPDLPENEREQLRLLLSRTAQQLCQLGELSSAHALFPRESALTPLGKAGFLPRHQEQYHFLNRVESEGARPYRSFDDFLAQLHGHRRTAIRHERRALRNAGIYVRTHRGLDEAMTQPRPADSAPYFSRRQLDQMFDLYVSTSLRYAGEPPYLNRHFFHLCAERLGDSLELVLAYEGGDDDVAEVPNRPLLAGAWNLRGDRRLFGRYWGAARHVPFLHFEVCYYHSIERCIAEGLEVFEPGHGGEHKLLRGFTPVLTHSAHYLRDASLRRPIAMFLRYEAPQVMASLAAAAARSPLRVTRSKSSSESSAETGSSPGAPRIAPRIKDKD